MLRCVVFAWLALSIYRVDFAYYMRVPGELRVAPPGYAGFFHLLPWHEAWATGVKAVALAACASAFLGWATQRSAWVACACAVYPLGVPEFFGKIDHRHHHLVWFAALLAASRSGDALSIDALRSAVRRADRGEPTTPPGPATAYALPLRLAWLLIGVAYFFAGLAKLRAGPRWILSDNIRNLMYRFWLEKGFTPAVRIDRFPLICRAAAAATVAFEISFLPALFFPWLRRIAVAGGIAFHLLTDVYLRIAFTELVSCYVVFVDWAALCAAFGRRAFRARLVISYDGQHRPTRRVVAVVRAVDVLRAVEWRDAASSGEVGRAAAHAVTVPGGMAGLALHLHAQRAATGRVLVAALLRLPLAVPLLPVVVFLARRARPSEDSPGRRVPIRRVRRPASAFAPMVVGSVLLGLNLYCGLFGIDSWPFGIYPNFAGIARPEYTTLEVVVRDASGRTTPVDTGLRPAALRRLLETEDGNPEVRLAALQEFLAHHRVSLGRGESLQVFEVTRSTLPDDRRKPPLRQALLSELGPLPPE